MVSTTGEYKQLSLVAQVVFTVVVVVVIILIFNSGRSGSGR